MAPKHREWRYCYHLRRKFGITPDEAEALAAVRACEACGRTVADFEEARRVLRIDHQHAEGEARNARSSPDAIRGVVCDRCNHALALLDGEPALLGQLRAYLDRTVVSVGAP